MALELRCGSARLTRCFQAEGLLGDVGIDYVRNKCKPVGPTVTLDLASDHGQEVVWRLLKSGRVVVVSMGVPCGTASRARECPMSAKQHGPRPLRTEEHPWGIPGLRGVEKQRVEVANELYRLAVDIFRYCVAEDIFVILENPKKSLLWSIPEVQSLLNLPYVQDRNYDACTHGGKRLKHQRLRSNIAELQLLPGECDGSHPHEPYAYDRATGQFSTAEEATYPWAFCENVANLTCQGLRRKGILLHADMDRKDLLTISAGKQPRGKCNPKVVCLSLKKSLLSNYLLSFV